MRSKNNNGLKPGETSINGHSGAPVRTDVKMPEDGLQSAPGLKSGTSTLRSRFENFFFKNAVATKSSASDQLQENPPAGRHRDATLGDEIDDAEAYAAYTAAKARNRDPLVPRRSASFGDEVRTRPNHDLPRHTQ